MRIGGDTRRRVQGIKEEMEEPLRQLETYLVRLNEHAGNDVAEFWRNRRKS